MGIKKVDLHEIEIQLMPLFYEINVLKFRVEESRPEVRARYRDLLANLSSQYNFVETQVRKLKEAQDEAWEEQLTVITAQLAGAAGEIQPGGSMDLPANGQSG